MTRLAAVLAGALEHIDRVGMHLDNHEAADQLVAAIPEPEREALEVGALWVEVMSRKRQSTDTLTVREVIRYGGGPPDYHHEWHAQMSMGDRAENGYGDTVAAALTALLDRLVAP